MAENYILLERIELNASAASVTFSNIPQSGYTDLKFVVSARSNYSAIGSGADLKFNNSSTGYSYKQLYGYSGGAGSVGNSSTTAISFNIAGATSTASTFSPVEFYIPNAFGNNYKSVSIEGANENNSTTGWQLDMFAYLWSNTASISTITLTENASSTFVAGSTFSLYGLAAVGTTPAIAPKASGGNVIKTDGTYWYHAFLSTGAFVPATNLTCDILQVAGGGGADNAGGGAGGVLAFASQSLANATSYTATVGAGGAGGGGRTNGVNSQFASLTASVGGGYGGSTTGNSGGSGGGSWAASGTTAGGTGTSGQGNNGGSSGSGGGGGGGGAGAAGANATSGTQGGSGGAGVNTVTNYGLLTTTLSTLGLGVSGYIAGGGGGYGSSTNSSGGSGGGGTGSAGGGSLAASAGVANTGSGGGNGVNGLGGSGIIIIRYLVA